MTTEKSSLRGLKTFLKGSSLGDDAYASLGSIPRPPHLVEILDQFWPECYTSEFSGKAIMAPEDAARLEALYRMFGVPMLVADNSLQILSWAYEVFVQGLGLFVNHKLRFPTTFGACNSFREYLPEWPDDWVHYVEAVAAENFSESRRLAKKLNVLAPDCVYPKGTHLDKPAPL